MPDAWDSEPPVRTIQAWRQGDWVHVALDGEVVYRRLTRDLAFSHVEVRFASNRSPSYPKTHGSFLGRAFGLSRDTGIVLRGPYLREGRSGFTGHRGNSDTVPIHPGPDRGPEWTPSEKGSSRLHVLYPPQPIHEVF